MLANGTARPIFESMIGNIEDHPPKEIYFFGDPMCSWCWGFSPELKSIAETYGDRVPITAIVGGLRAGNTKVMDEKSKDYIRHHWQEVQQATGQPFYFTFFDRDDFIYDTEPACRAVVTMRSLKPAATLEYFEAAHKAFYADNQDITKGETLAGLAEPFGFIAAEFKAAFETQEVRNQTQVDFQVSQQLGVQGFTTLVLRDGEVLRALSQGYRTFDQLSPMLEQWIEEPPEKAQAMVDAQAPEGQSHP